MIHVEGNMCGAVMRGAVALPGSKATSRTKGSHRNLGDLVWPAVATAIPGRGRKARSRRCLGTGEESDGPRSTGEAPEQGRDERRRRAWREGGSVGGMADDGRCSGRGTGPSILYPPLACGSATRSNVRARPIALDFRQEPGAGKPHAGICAGGREQSLSLPRPRAEMVWPRKPSNPLYLVRGRAAAVIPNNSRRLAPVRRDTSEKRGGRLGGVSARRAEMAPPRRSNRSEERVRSAVFDRPGFGRSASISRPVKSCSFWHPSD